MIKVEFCCLIFEIMISQKIHYLRYGTSSKKCNLILLVLSKSAKLELFNRIKN